MRATSRSSPCLACSIAVAVVVFIYVNPSQFAPTEDLATYPSDFAGDLSKLTSTDAVHAAFSSKLRVVSAADASSIGEPIDGDSEALTGIVLSLDSCLLFATGHSKLIRVWDLASRTCIRSWKVRL
ncbi:hypothetical protein ZWY2020_030377 [Hordeum vulgare]|nr:hypothetical protein ZWY2020_030377 [Hordeum vulgare]